MFVILQVLEVHFETKCAPFNKNVKSNAQTDLEANMFNV